MISNSTCNASGADSGASSPTPVTKNWIHFEITNSSGNWAEVENLSRELERSIIAICKHVARRPGGDVLVSIALASDDEVQRLNRDYRQQDKPTNVLSFPTAAMPDGHGSGNLDDPQPIGDVVLADETVRSEAQQAAIPMINHVCHMAIHGILHLLGYDHQNDAEASEMEQLEIDILAELGIDNPYQGAPHG